jgi:hypothetical protein
MDILRRSILGICECGQCVDLASFPHRIVSIRSRRLSHLSSSGPASTRKTRYSKNNNATMHGGAIEEKESYYDDKIEIKRRLSPI